MWTKRLFCKAASVCKTNGLITWHYKYVITGQSQISDSSPAAKIGIQCGDRVTHVQGKSVCQMSAHVVHTLMSQQACTLLLTVERWTKRFSRCKFSVLKWNKSLGIKTFTYSVKLMEFEGKFKVLVDNNKLKLNFFFIISVCCRPVNVRQNFESSKQQSQVITPRTAPSNTSQSQNQGQTSVFKPRPPLWYTPSVKVNQ